MHEDWKFEGRRHTRPDDPGSSCMVAASTMVLLVVLLVVLNWIWQ